MKFVFFSASENRENGLGDEGADGEMPSRILLEPSLTISLPSGDEMFDLLTWNKSEVEVMTCRILITAGAVARQPELEWRTVSRSVSVDCTDCNDRLAWRLVLVDNRPIVGRKLGCIIVDVE